jgi:hypothetical protein
VPRAERGPALDVDDVVLELMKRVCTYRCNDPRRRELSWRDESGSTLRCVCKPINLEPDDETLPFTPRWELKRPRDLPGYQEFLEAGGIHDLDGSVLR